MTRSYPDAITSPLDPPRMDGTEATIPMGAESPDEVRLRHDRHVLAEDLRQRHPSWSWRRCRRAAERTIKP